MFSYLKRSLDVIKEQGARIARANPAHWDKEKLLLTLNSQEDLKEWVLGCDKDIGGYSNANLEITPEGVGRFSGNISLELPKNNPIIEKSGYAAIRSMDRRSLFGPVTWDTMLFRYLTIRLRGDHRKYFVNIQTDGPIPTDLYQHRLFLKKPGEWETVMIPFKDFILTNQGIIQDPQVIMYREKVRTIGFSLLSQPGTFCLEIDWIKMMNTEHTAGDDDI
ncbi:13760_t:CDS:2 [Acaulospora colombiana]|uniref:13760_t:CDS:1 n=1 Tax=Acaulospora colombiana TaxID=27376 RepID=A0ACA9LJ58_9GLOM|nr:13760_t:CDS:2 [Acaulospora colombiana]